MINVNVNVNVTWAHGPMGPVKKKTVKKKGGKTSRKIKESYNKICCKGFLGDHF